MKPLILTTRPQAYLIKIQPRKYIDFSASIIRIFFLMGETIYLRFYINDNNRKLGFMVFTSRQPSTNKITRMCYGKLGRISAHQLFNSYPWMADFCGTYQLTHTRQDLWEADLNHPYDYLESFGEK
jgi:hypothetical protein